MWLLHTSTGELRWFNSNERVRYAILSHVWTKDEQTFEQVRALHHSGGGLAHVSDKIRNFCVFARARGYTWVWVDTCCIDKTSSSELSEAINSMFKWYASAAECVAFLADVPEHQNPSSPGSAFRRSRWFTRGWTLQELIAPREVLFVGEQWTVLGSKGSLKAVIAEVTNIVADVLTHEQSFETISVAERMSWAAKRETTRMEDEAYCLMGLFSIYMPTIYGEGRNAFTRLQEEILRTTSDQTIFAWGPIWTGVGESALRRMRWGGSMDTLPDGLVRFPDDWVIGTPWEDGCERLLAVSPRQFAACQGITSLSSESFAEALRRFFHHRVAMSFGNIFQWLRYNVDHPEVRIDNHTLSRFTVHGDGVSARMPTCVYQTRLVGLLACRWTTGHILAIMLQKVGSTGLCSVGNSLGTVLSYWHASAREMRFRIREIPIEQMFKHPLNLLGPIIPTIPYRIVLDTLKMREFTIPHRIPHPDLALAGPERPALAHWPRCEIIIPPWSFHALKDQGFRFFLLNAPPGHSLGPSPQDQVAAPVSDPLNFALITNPPHFKLSQLTRSFVLLRLILPATAAAIDILLRPCSAPFNTHDHSETFHISAAYCTRDLVVSSSPPAEDSADLSGPTPLESHPLAKLPPSEPSVFQNQAFLATAYSPCIGLSEAGQCTDRTLRKSITLMHPTLTTWAIHISSDRIAQGSINMYSLGIEARWLITDGLANVRQAAASAESSQAGAAFESLNASRQFEQPELGRTSREETNISRSSGIAGDVDSRTQCGRPGAAQPEDNIDDSESPSRPETSR